LLSVVSPSIFGVNSMNTSPAMMDSPRFDVPRGSVRRRPQYLMQQAA
jgi:hypothetical protein